MKNRKIISILLLTIGSLLSVAFILKIDFPQGFEVYFKREYYNQYGPLAISIELLMASYYLLIGDKKANFLLALFGFTALLDIVFHQVGLFTSIMPLYGSIILSICALLSLWFAFKNPFELKRLSYITTLLSVILAVISELFFNYY